MFMKYRGLFQREATPVLWKQDKFRFIDSGCFWLSDTPWKPSGKWDEKFVLYRICTYVILEHRENKERITFFNTHFGFGDRCHEKSASLIYEYSKKTAEGPLVITGDFNMTPTSAGYAQIIKYYKDANKCTLNYTGTTFHNYAPETQDEHIDYCFIDEKIKPLNTVLLDQTFDGKYPSDHYGFYFELEI